MYLGIKLADGNQFLCYNDNTSHYDGCPTCDYGSEYINDISIETTHYRIQVEFNAMYEYAFDTATAIKMFAVDLSSMSEDEFVNYLDEKLHEIRTPERFEINKKGECK